MTTLSDWPTLLGMTAATLTTGAFVPQAWLTVRTRSVAGLSIPMYTLFTLGVALWLAYGIALRAWPIILANAITLLLALIILGVAVQCSRHNRRAAHRPTDPPQQP